MANKLQKNPQVQWDDESQPHQNGAAVQWDNEPAAAAPPVDPNAPRVSDPGAWNAVKRVGRGLLELPGQMFGQEDRDPDEKLISAATPDSGILRTMIKGAKRLVVDPARSELRKADDYDLQSAAHPEQADNFYDGSANMATMHRMAAVVPFAGPLAANIAERKIKGNDASGAYTELGTLIAAPKALEKVGDVAKAAVGKVAYPMADRMMKTPTGTGEINPVDAFTPKEIKDFAEDPKQGPTVNMTPAEITESGGLRAVQGIGQKSLFGKGLLQERAAGSQSAVIGRSRNLMKKVAPNETNTVQTARALKQQVEAAGVKAKAAANTDYANWRASIPGNIDIDLSDINKKYGNMLDSNKDVFNNIPADQAGKLKSAMSKASNFGLDDFEEEGDSGEPTGKNPVMDLDAVREMRSHWLDALRDLKQKGRADSREAGLYSDIVSDLDGSIEKGLRQHGEASTNGTVPEKTAAGNNLVKGWRNANASWKKYIEDFHGDDSVLADIANTPQTDLVKMPGKILEKGTGGNPVHISQLREHGIGLGGLQREVMDRALNSGFRTPQNKLAGFDDDFLQHVFADNPKDLEALYKNARIGKSVGVDFNPSNTAGALNARSEFEAPAKAAFSLVGGEPKSALMEVMDAVPGYGAAKLSTSNWFKRWMTRTPQGPIGKWLLNKKGGGGPSGSSGGGGSAPVTPKPTTPGAGGTGTVAGTESSPLVTGSGKLAKSAAATSSGITRYPDKGGWPSPPEERTVSAGSKPTPPAMPKLEKNLPIGEVAKDEFDRAVRGPDKWKRQAAEGRASDAEFNFGSNKLKKQPQTVGSAAGAKSDTAHYQQAAKELGAGASISDIAKRAQELKDTATKKKPAK